ncbi:uncharacterized protein LOC128203113 [Mya arenaria]|uniref:uncharacterized protein LOC128203113 n=1 Tax=Mya arenaria TaxID=6604 RepID=UPI0022E8079C|nr:uncharacterized protein LOC128203113 [Mya arenaria]
MNRLMIVAIAVALALLITTPRTEGCSCLPRDTEDMYCNSDYAAIIVLKNISEPFYENDMDQGPWNMVYEYGIEVGFDFKDTIFPNPLLQAKSNSGLCGVDFQPNGTYLIIANFADNMRPGEDGLVLSSWSCAFNRYFDMSDKYKALGEMFSYLPFLFDKLGDDYSCENVTEKRTSKKSHSTQEKDLGDLSALQEQARNNPIDLQRKVDVQAGRDRLRQLLQTAFQN